MINLEHWTSLISNWAAQSPYLLLTSITIVAFLESIAIAGIIVPGIALLFALATLAGSSQVSLFAVITAAAIGAIAGDLLSFALGYHHKETIKKIKPFQTNPQWLKKGEIFFDQFGLISVVLGRFIGPLRPIIPLIAGMLNMRPSWFISINVISALAWSPFYILPGFLVGSHIDGLMDNQQWLYAFSIIAIISLCLALAHQTLQSQLKMSNPKILNAIIITPILVLSLASIFLLDSIWQLEQILQGWLISNQRLWLLEISNLVTRSIRIEWLIPVTICIFWRTPDHKKQLLRFFCLITFFMACYCLGLYIFEPTGSLLFLLFMLPSLHFIAFVFAFMSGYIYFTPKIPQKSLRLFVRWLLPFLVLSSLICYLVQYSASLFAMIFWCLGIMVSLIWSYQQTPKKLRLKF